jgi:hypothetical protein
MHHCIALTAALRLLNAMIAIIKFMNRHPLGVILLTSLLTLGSMGAMLLFYPQWVDQQLIDKLGSSEYMVRGQAIVEAATRAKNREQMRQKLIATLNTENDKQFFAIFTVLNASGPQDTDSLHFDRALAIEFATARDIDTKIWLLSQIIKKRHDNRYVRQMLKAAAASKEIAVRTDAALLAAMLKDDAILGKLMDDKDPTVRAAAALDAGLAGIASRGDTLVEKLTDSDANVAGNAAAGLAYLDPDKYGPELCKLLTETKNADLRERLFHVMTILNNDIARKAVNKPMSSPNPIDSATPMRFLAASKLHAAGPAGSIRLVLTDAVKNPKINRYLIHSAIVAAGDLNVPARKEIYQICKKYWNPDWRSKLMFAATARLLGRQTANDTDQPAGAPTRLQCENMLISAAYYTHRQPTTGPAAPIKKTPIASAAAATAFWLLHPSSDPNIQLEKVTSDSATTEFTGRNVSGANVIMYAARASILAGDYIAWYVGRSGKDEAFKLALRMLPPLDAPIGQHIYNENLRGSGAMMLALAAKTDEQKQIAIQRITERLEPGKTHRGEDDPVLAGRYRCALLILGESNQLKLVIDQRNNSGHAIPAALTALILAGDIETLDYLLCNSNVPPRDIAAYIVSDGLDRVLAACAPDLPIIDPSAPWEIQLWQAQIVSDYYVLHRRTLSLGTKR